MQINFSITFQIITFLLLAGNSSARNPTPLTQVPFKQLIGGVIMFKAQIGDHPDTLNFILDTGSGGVSVDSSTAARLRLPSIPSEMVIRGIAGMHKTNIVPNMSLQLAALRVDSLNFHMGDYEILSGYNGENIHGIVGYSVLNKYIVAIDYDSLFLSFYPKGTFTYPKGGFLLHPTLNKVPELECNLNDKVEVKTKLLVDLGAGVSLMLSQNFAIKNLDITRRKKLSPKAIQGVGGTVSMQITVVKKLKVGKYRFRNVPTYLFNDVYQLTTHRRLGGLLGNDLLRRFNLVLNYGKSEIHLLPNSHYLEDFDYVYSGVELCAENEKVSVCDLAEDSPAKKAGMMIGDIVLAVDTDFSSNLKGYKTLLQKKVGTIKVLLQQNGSAREILIETIDIRKGR